MKSPTVLSAQNISIGYGKTKHNVGKCLYNNLTFELKEGELTCLIGTNGAGKSTLLRSISGNQAILDGEVYFKNKNISEYKEKDLSLLMGLVLTDKTNVGGLTVSELVSLGRYPHTGFFGNLSAKDHSIVEKAMSDVNILHKAGVYTSELSDGERQKAMIAKVLCQECPVMLLDEPTAFLDIEGRFEIMSLLHDLSVNQNKTILLSTHDIDLALRLADRLWLLSPSEGFVSGATEDLVISGKMKTFFNPDTIEFREDLGYFQPVQKINKKAKVVTKEQYLEYWCKNILARHGYKAVENTEESSIIIELGNRNKIVITTHKASYYLQNFEELATILRNM